MKFTNKSRAHFSLSFYLQGQIKCILESCIVYCLSTFFV